MTKNEVLKQLYDLSVNGNFNHKGHYSFSGFKNLVDEKFCNRKSKCILEVELPDGWWYVIIKKLQNKMWDYYIPDSREENDIIKNMIMDEYRDRKENEQYLLR